MWPYVSLEYLAMVYTNTWQIVGFLSAGLVFTSSVINALVYQADGAKEAAAAGFILLSMVAVCS